MPVRSFIAITIPDNLVISKIRNVQNRLASTGADIKLVDPENIHLTLKFLGDVDESRLEQVMNLVREITFEPSIMKLDGVGVFPNLGRPRTIWAGITLGVEPLSDIFNFVDSKLVDLGFKRESRRFNPHITLGRVRGGRNRQLLVKVLLELADTCFGDVIVNKIILKKSVLTSKGPIYSNLAISGGI